jgi:threonine dehydrogenase-like Zn-dependent dehydrogenase
MNTAQVAIFKAAGAPFEFTERPLPACGEGQALVAISLATICGSDLHTTDGRRTEPRPCVLGHEAVGRVVAVGPGRDPALLGQRVTWTLADSCGECVPCRAWHLPQKCEHLFKYGHAPLDDGSGFNGCALLHAAGLERVIVVDNNPHRLALVQAFGGEPALDSAASLAPAGRVDAVFEVAGTSAVVPEGVHLLRPGGFYGFVGMVHPATLLALTGETVVRRCLTLRGFHNYAPSHLRRAVGFLHAHHAAYPWRSLVSDVLPLAQLSAAFELARTQRWPRVAVRP